ncbi:DNA-binding transcriptional regulator, XRE-family HTH domain [Andreprevotia lacus DSM 23236]|uniref:DNA-binding transcriptional regulator, XRE-family HTH domain n=1 Tax=Andreprevotia lacus DSM 23236 TaxID=1121001 RepID=A0A1W1XW44_9NEIS|nr:helix-turn-helix transcriptional regulator [Andreprevotia lacus]SMC27738.1 DNA-binding transcriptional regulator, XRE-family HTH domain [Andreprevotia lacus DSM 23236]
MEAEEAFGIALRKLRKQRKLSQEKLALEADVERNYISLLELGRNSASIKVIFKLAKVLGVRPSELVGLAEAEQAQHG